MSKDTIHLFNNVSVKGIIANGSIGTTGQTLASNGTVAYWSDITGYTGSVGFTGSRGTDGYAGSVGFTGSRGTDGYAGSVGFTGSQGPIGFTGSWGGTAQANVDMNNYSINNANNIGAVNVTVSGNLTVSGAVTTVNTTNLDVFDAIIRLNRGQVTPSNDIGILMQRFAAANAASYNVGFAWEEGTDRLIFGTTPEDGSDNDLSFASEWMTIAANGNVGIGTATPAAFLHVNSTGPQARWDVASATDARHEYYRNGLREGYISWDANLMSLAATQASGVVTFASGGTTERMRIAANGNVGIGNTAPGSRLTILANSSNSFQFTKPDGTNLMRALWDGSNFHHYFDGNVYYNLANTTFTFSGGGSLSSNFLSIINGARISVNDQPTGVVSGLVFAGSGSYANSTTTLSNITPLGIRTWAWNGTDGFTLNTTSYVTQRQLSAANNDAVVTFNTNFAGTANDIIRMYTANSNVEIVAGNVGIGTALPGGKLDVQSSTNNDVRIFSTSASSKTRLFIRASTTNMSYETDNSNSSHYLFDNAGGVVANRYIIGANSNWQFFTAGTERVRISNTGNFGIGNTAPAATLHVQGGVLVGGDGGVTYDFKLQRLNATIRAVQHDFAASSNSPWILHGENLSWTGERAGTVESSQAFRPYYEAFSPAAGYKEFGFVNVTSGNFTTTNLIPSLTLANTGNIGIGTNSPTVKLELAGDLLITSESIGLRTRFISGKASPGNTAGPLYLQYNSSDFVQVGGGTGSANFYVANGNLGIGQTSPGARLDITSTTAFSARIAGPANVYQDITDGTGTLRLQLLSSSPFVTSIGSYPFVLGANNTEAMRITSTGNVGIGNSSPASKLVVAGNVQISTGGLNSVNGAIVVSNTGSGSATITISTANTSANGGVGTEYIRSRVHSNQDLAFVTDARLYFQSAGANWSRGVTYTTTSPFTTVSGTGQHFGISTVDARSNATSSGVFSDLDVSHTANTAAGASATLQYSVITSSTTESSWSGTANNAMLYSGYNAGTLRYRVNRNGDIWTNGSITVTSTLATGNTTITGDLSVTGNTTLGDAAADTVTINANTITIAANSNIDAGTLYIDSVNNRIGIGTTAPQNLLHLESASPVIRFRDTDSAAGTYSTISSDNTTGSFLISADSANTAASSTISFLTDGAERVRFTGTGSALFLGSASQTLDIGTTTGVSYIQSYGSGLANTPLALYTGTSERMRIAADGNVGIGSTNPAVKFVISNAGAEGYEINPTGGVGGGATVSAYNRSTPGYTTLTTYASAMTWYANGSTRAIDLASNGNVGINTSAPSSKFDVVGGDGDGIVYRTSTRSIGIGQLNADPTLYWGSGTPLRFFSGSELARISNTGNVGIGTNNPLVKLHLFDSNAPETRLQIGNTLSEGAYTFYSGSTKEAAIGFIPNSAFLNISSGRSAGWGGTITFTTDTSERIRIAANGNVGIGNSAPGALLHVNGDTRLASNATGGNWISFQRTGTNAWKMGSDGVGDVFTVVGNLVTFEQNVTIRRQGLTVTPTTETLQAVDISQTWNNAAATFAALKLNITDTASNANSLLMNLQTGGVSQFIVRKDGNVGIGTSNPARKLTVQGDSAGTLTVAAFYNADLTNNNGSVFSFRTDTSGAGAQSFWEYAGVSGVVNEHNNATRAGSLNFFTANSTGLANRLTIVSDGNVGIANATPTDRLSVNGTGYFSDNLSIVRNNTAGSLTGLTINNPGTSTAYSGINITSGTVTSQLFNDAAGNAVVAGAVLRTTSNHPFVFGTNNTERMRIDNIGNIGVDTTPSPWGSTYKALEVRTGAVYDTAVGTASGFTFNAYFNGTNWIYKGTGGNATALRYEQISGQHRWFTAPTGAGGGTITFTQTMTLDASGNLGIANTTPGDKLSVTGAISVTGQVKSPSSTYYFDATNGLANFFNAYFANWYGSDSVLRIVAASGRTYFAPTAGNVAIANTSTAPNALFVTGDIGLDGISVRDTATATTTAVTQITLFEYPIATYDSSDIIIKAVRAGERHTTKVLVTANSTVAIATEYGTLTTGSSLYTVDADISGANTRIRITPSSTTSTVFKASYELITT